MKFLANMFKPDYYAKGVLMDNSGSASLVDEGMMKSESAELKLILYKFISVSRKFSNILTKFDLSDEDKKKAKKSLYVFTDSSWVLDVVLLSIISIFFSSFLLVFLFFSSNFELAMVFLGIFFVSIVGLFSNPVRSLFLRNRFEIFGNNHALYTYAFLKEFGIDLFKPIGKQRDNLNYFLVLCQDIFVSYDNKGGSGSIERLLSDGYKAFDSISRINEASSDRGFYLSGDFKVRLGVFDSLVGAVLYLIHNSALGYTEINGSIVKSIVEEFDRQDKEQLQMQRGKLDSDESFNERKRLYLMELLKK